MVNQNKTFSFRIKRQEKKVFPKDVERTVDEDEGNWTDDAETDEILTLSPLVDERKR